MLISRGFVTGQRDKLNIVESSSFSIVFCPGSAGEAFQR